MSRLLVALLRHGPTLAALSRALPDRFRMIDTDGSMDGRTLRTRAAELAARWAAVGVGPGTRLAVLAEGRAGVLGLLAGSLTGAELVTLDPRSPPALLQSMITATGADGVCRAGPAGQLEVSVPVHDIDLDSPAGHLEPPPLTPRHGGRLLLRSTGTSGHPRTSGRARYDVRSLAPTLALARRLRLWRREPMMITPPLHHGYGLGLLTLALLTGTPVVLTPRTDAGALVSMMRSHRVSVLITTPPTLQRLAEQGLAEQGLAEQGLAEQQRADHSPKSPVETLRAIVTGSGPLHPNLAEVIMDTFGEVLHNLYGTTEGGWSCLATPADLRAAPGTVGRAVLGTRIRIINGEVFVASPLATQSQTIFAPTGDLGHLDDRGRLHLHGRRDDLVVVGGVNVDLAGVEATLRTLPGVADVVLRATPDPAFGHTLHAQVVTAERFPGLVELQHQLAQCVAPAAMPRSWSVVESVERTPFGAVRRES